MDVALIETLARLRGIGDAYHDYRGELKHFSIETKIGILRAMGCAVDDPAALKAELSELEDTPRRQLLPADGAAPASGSAVSFTPMRSISATNVSASNAFIPLTPH